MAIDSSIYQNIRPIETPDLMSSMGKAMSLSQLALQNRKLQSDAATQDAMKQAYAKNMGQDGKLNQQGVLSDLANSSPEALMSAQEHFTKMNKAETEGKTANVELATKIAAAADPYMEYLAKLPEDQRAQQFHPVIKQMEASGIPTNNIPKTSDGTYLYGGRDGFAQLYGSFQNAKQHLENLQTDASTREKNSATAKNYAEIGKITNEANKVNPALLGQTDDPAKLIPLMVPKEHQAAAFKEVDAAENTKKMASSILDSFDQAANDTSGLGAVGSIIKTPRSVQALHQSMQPTFKDLEGTVRQAAMDNTFKNITPNAADTKNDIEIKRAALNDYLQSKLSAPVSRGYGVDLSKFDSTSPYASGPKQTASSGSSIVPSANAASSLKHGTVEDGYVFMGGDPSNPKSWKRTK